MQTIYLDNGATSFPKAPGVTDAMVRYLDTVGASINRGVYASAQQAALTALQLREKLCALFHHPDPTHCILTPGATWGLNMVLRGWLRPGDHCLVSSMEHNAVMRPLTALAGQGVSFDRIPCDRQGRLDLSAIPAMVLPNTRLLVLAHASNVGGAVQDAPAVGKICQNLGIPFLLDAAQTAGHWPVDFTAFGLSALAVPGHKGLLGPAGTGALLLSRAFASALTPLITGGTGSASHTEEQPAYMPDKFEPGTPNLPGIYGLEAAVSWLLDRGIESIRHHEETLTSRFLAQVQALPGVRVAGPTETGQRVGVISLDFSPLDNAKAAFFLEQRGILTRCGLHCSPSAHRTLGTFPQGAVRFTPGPFTRPEEMDAAALAVTAFLNE